MIKTAVIMDPIANINIAKDTSFALLLGTQARGHENHYIEPHDIWLQDGIVWGKMHRIQVKDDPSQWYEIGDAVLQPLTEMDLILLRKDPPFNMEYIYLTYLLELVTQHGTAVINQPDSVRDANEKLFTAWFPQCCPPSLVTSNKKLILEFLQQFEHTVIKPLDSMGGNGIFQLQIEDKNSAAIIDSSTLNGTKTVMTQQFLPEIEQGDKRIIMINGTALPLGLARIPDSNDFRGNLNAGATGVVFDLTERDHWIAEQVGDTLRQKGLALVGLDIIGEHLTEINVTSPTCLREIQRESATPLLEPFYQHIESLCRQ